MRFLARREYSRLELIRKLLARSFHSEMIDAVLDSLEHRGYLSDERFAELLVRSRISACYGPFKIKFELREKGVTESVIDKVMGQHDVDWVALAVKAKEKRFGQAATTDINELAKQVRYLKGRGFYHQHVDLVVPSPGFSSLG